MFIKGIAASSGPSESLKIGAIDDVSLGGVAWEKELNDEKTGILNS